MVNGDLVRKSGRILGDDPDSSLPVVSEGTIRNRDLTTRSCIIRLNIDARHRIFSIGGRIREAARLHPHLVCADNRHVVPQIFRGDAVRNHNIGGRTLSRSLSDINSIPPAVGHLHIPDLDVVRAVNANAHSALAVRVGRLASLKISLNPAADHLHVADVANADEVIILLRRTDSVKLCPVLHDQRHPAEQRKTDGRVNTIIALRKEQHRDSRTLHLLNRITQNIRAVANLRLSVLTAAGLSVQLRNHEEIHALRNVLSHNADKTGLQNIPVRIVGLDPGSALLQKTDPSLFAHRNILRQRALPASHRARRSKLHVIKIARNAGQLVFTRCRMADRAAPVKITLGLIAVNHQRTHQILQGFRFPLSLQRVVCIAHRAVGKLPV